MNDSKTDMKLFVVTMAVFLVLLLWLSSCKKKDVDDCPCPGKEWREPVLQGKCVVDRYFDHKAYDQWCDYKGYSWKCGPEDCVRAGEAKGEHPATIPIAPIAPSAGSGSGSGA